MQQRVLPAIFKNFLGNSPQWYKYTILAFLLLNPILFQLNPYIAGWVLVLEFIFTLAMALKCYPLQPGGLLAIEAMFIGMTSAGQVEHEIVQNVDVILLLIFMVAGIYFMKDLLLYIFTKLVVSVRSKTVLSLSFTLAAAFLSAFLDALTVMAVVIAVAMGFYSIYHKVASGKDSSSEHDINDDNQVRPVNRQELEEFRAFLRNLLMHASIGTALGGVCTMVGEPQNLIIAERAGWFFGEFFFRMLPITLPVMIAGVATTILLEKTKTFGYGAKLPVPIHTILSEHAKKFEKKRTTRDKVNLAIQAVIAVWLIIGLALHLATVGLIGLSVIIFATASAGIIEEHQLGKAFEEALPFTALLCVFFSIVAVIIDQHLFTPVISWVLTFEGQLQLVMFFIANGLLSMVSDNVFVGTVYINEVAAALEAGQISRDQFDLLAVAINTGTNLPSVATPNGQAAFLFLLTSTLAPVLRLSYGRMVFMALPYTIVLTVVGLSMTLFSLSDMTELLYQWGLIQHHSGGLPGSLGGH
ncbi:sodium/proton antiporter NhaB [Pseudoalteromonas lipolytica]|uniref:Na(+)/H(+) antiporter NhaB n=1 Tax=Pseudoalteromonas lipolytica TaxID=570156 RepID=A0AAD0WCX1_9GAMM|nr:sodium/proton antiporter NhaB [Pseudoalteromonas donghaensis]AXV65740.1 sodium/proton antiporter NhaB [Pseudoalteromonas donghaensis]